MVQIFASGGLNEFEVDALVRAGAPIEAFGVGTKVGVSADAPWTDCAYKLVEYDGRPVLKFSSKKQTLPGAKQVFRHRDPEGTFLGDILASNGESVNGAKALLGEVMKDGKRLRPSLSLEELRQRFRREFACLPERHKALKSPEPYEVLISQELLNLQRRVVEEVKRREVSLG